MKKFWREIFFKTVTLLVGLGIAFCLTHVFKDHEGTTKVIISLVGGCVGLLWVEFIRISEKFDKQAERLDKMSAILSEQAFDDAKRAALLRVPQQELKDSEQSQAWIELLWSVRKSYIATNHIPDADIYKRGFAKKAFEIQKAKQSAGGIPIAKIFVLADEEELKNMQETMKGQRAAGFDVRYIYQSALDQHADLQKQTKSMETVDFGIFDSEIVLLWLLNSTTRKPEGGRILTGHENVERYQKYFNALRLNSTEFIA